MTDIEEKRATVTAVPNGWHLVEHCGWQISVGPDGVIRLPLHLSAEEVPDFVAAINAAADHARDQATGNTDAVPAVLALKASPSHTTPPPVPQTPGLARSQPLRATIGRRGTAGQTKQLRP